MAMVGGERIIPRDEIKRIKKRIGSKKYSELVGPSDSAYVHRIDGGLVRGELPIRDISASHEAVLKLAEWVHKQLEWRVKEEGEPPAKSPLGILERGSGNCNDKGGVLAAFSKAIGLPAHSTGVGHGLTLLKLPENDVAVEFFPSNYMISTREGQWELGRDDSGNEYMRYRNRVEPVLLGETWDVPDDERTQNVDSLYQHQEHDVVFGRRFKEPINIALKALYQAKYSDIFRDWDKERFFRLQAVKESHERVK